MLIQPQDGASSLESEMIAAENTVETNANERQKTTRGNVSVKQLGERHFRVTPIFTPIKKCRRRIDHL